ncbi:uncharacterized protein LOC136095619 [Hydra vulgaris]|uniref:uncharacterized protein LOC136095619 n=1 Tax=Hydra vulgaris TaxID=6087 RepID=UPI0032E9C626
MTTLEKDSFRLKNIVSEYAIGDILNCARKGERKDVLCNFSAIVCDSRFGLNELKSYFLADAWRLIQSIQPLPLTSNLDWKPYIKSIAKLASAKVASLLFKALLDKVQNKKPINQTAINSTAIIQKNHLYESDLTSDVDITLNSSIIINQVDTATENLLCDSNSTAIVHKNHLHEGDLTRDIDIDLNSSISINQICPATENVLEAESLEYHLPSNDELFKLNKNPDILQKLYFIKKHPIQPSFFSNIQLDLQKLYFRKTSDGKKISRKWLSVLCIDNELKALYCPFCIAFSSSLTTFSNGCNNFKHIHEVVKIHEESLTHRHSVEAYIQSSNDKSVEFGINNNLMALKKSQIQDNIHVISEVFEIVKFLGRKNLPFRGPRNSESLYKWNDEDNLNKGNFLELVKFTAKWDATLYKHLNAAIKNSKRRKDNLEKKSLISCSRGSLIDSTQDVGVVDQAAVCIWYIYEGEVKERLFALLKVVDSSGNGYYDMLKKLFSEDSINFNHIIGESFDGAANMRGEYSGLQSKIKSQENQKSVYIWCYSHVLNLCVCDTCKGVEAKKLFGFLNRLSTFFSDSYKRMHIWLSEIVSSLGSNKLKKLQKIGENNTRWWSREKALFWIFDGDKCLFPTVVSALHHISISRNFEPKVCSEASSLLDNLCSFKIILTAHIFLNIFKIIGPTSRYLQTRGMDLISAWSMVDSVKQEIGHLTFDNILENSVHFSNNMNDLLNSMNLPDDLLVPSTLPITRQSRKKRMYDELYADETPELPLDKFRVETYQSIVDHINNSLNERFTDNNQLIADVQYLIPKNFKQIEQMPNTALKDTTLLRTK